MIKLTGFQAFISVVALLGLYTAMTVLLLQVYQMNMIFEFQNKIESQLKIVKNEEFHASESIKEFLNRKYSDPLDFLEHFMKFMTKEMSFAIDCIWRLFILMFELTLYSVEGLFIFFPPYVIMGLVLISGAIIWFNVHNP
jgi:hypothetical protein